MFDAEPHIGMFGELRVQINDPWGIAGRVATGPSLKIELNRRSVDPGQNIGIDYI
tara:strand:+ start:62 stop:226 length:165 start_codon:yes stop_codon:yes gene_type:complete